MVGKKDSPVEPPSSLKIAQEFLAEYFENYFSRRDLKQLKKMLAPEFTGIGSARHEIAHSAAEAVKSYKEEFAQINKPITAHNVELNWQPLSEKTFVAWGKIDIRGSIDKENFEVPNVRFSLIIGINRGKGKLQHFHLSTPQEDPGDPESFPIRRLSEELKVTEQKYQLIYENSPIGILYYDNQGAILDCNDKFLQIINSTREKLKKVNMLCLPDEKALKAVKEALAGKTGYYNSYYRSITSNKVTPLRAVTTAMYDHSDRIIGGIAIYEDMSEFKDTENRLQHHFRFERLISNISTRFVNCTMGEIDQVIENSLRLTCEFFDIGRGYIFTYDSDAGTITNTHEWCAPGVRSLKEKYQAFRLFDCSFLDGFQNQTIDHYQISDLNEMPSEVNEFRTILEEDETKGILLLPLFREGQAIGMFGYDSLTNSRVWTNEEISLLKVVGEIFSNALSRKEAEHQKILVESYRHQTENSDSLAKLTEAVAQQFNNQLQLVIGNLELLKFDSSDPRKKKKHDAIKAVMKAAELSSMLMSYLGETHGKTPEEMLQLKDRQAQTLPVQLEGGHILVVEGDQMLRFITTSMLQHFNFKILEARDGTEAVQVYLANQKTIRLVICDLVMQGINGWQTLAALRKKAPGLPFILASGYDDAMAVKGSHTEVPQAFLRKPFNAASLQEAIRLALTS
jgi:PAS domain S-box-containing protein